MVALVIALVIIALVVAPQVGVHSVVTASGMWHQLTAVDTVDTAGPGSSVGSGRARHTDVETYAITLKNS